MIPIIIFPIPFDAWHTFHPCVKRFTDSFKDHPPGTNDYEVWAMCCWGEPTEEIRQMFYCIKTRFVPYLDHGCDIGSAQYAARMLQQERHDPDQLIMGLTSWCYFHRKGWLSRYVEAREKYGKGLYCASTSNEGGKLHACTRAYAMDASLWWDTPYVDRREKGPWFETGRWCLTDRILEKKLPIVQVTWDGERELADSRHPYEKGIFRRGDQNAMLVWDRHTDIYRDALISEKKRLANLADFGKEEGQ